MSQLIKFDLKDGRLSKRLSKYFGEIRMRKPRKRRGPGAEQLMKENLLRKWLEAENIEYKQEYVFWEGRRFRFDYALPKYLIAVEIEGGCFIPGGGGHNRGPGMRSNMEKYNEAAMLGWKVLRYMPENLELAIRDIMRVLGRGC